MLNRLEAQSAYPNLDARIQERSRSPARRCALRIPLAVGDSLVWLQMTNYCKDLQRVKSVTVSEVRKLAELP